MVGHQNEDDFDVSHEDSIIDRIIYERSDIRVRVETLTIIENLLIMNAYFHNSFLSCLQIRCNFVVPSLTGSSSKLTG